MALSVKVALLTCIFFTGTLCYLVQQTGRPLTVGIPLNFDQSGRIPIAARDTAKPSASDEARAERFSRGSPIARTRTAADIEKTVVADAPRGLIGENEPTPLPAFDYALLAMQPRDDAANGEHVIPSANSVVTEPTAAPSEVAAYLASDTLSARMLQARPGVTADVYTVQKGDSVSRICQSRLGSRGPTAIQAFLAENPEIAKRKGHALLAGESVRLPKAGGKTVSDDPGTDMGGYMASASWETRVLPAPGEPGKARGASATRGSRATEKESALPAKTASAKRADVATRARTASAADDTRARKGAAPGQSATKSADHAQRRASVANASDARARGERKSAVRNVSSKPGAPKPTVAEKKNARRPTRPTASAVTSESATLRRWCGMIAQRLWRELA